MPQQLIYTSAPVGLVPGRSGFCTVARSASMRESLVPQLEQISYYQHESPSKGHDRQIRAYRIIDVRGSRFHVLSCTQNTGMDFTGRPNFIAHHLVFAPEEFRQFPTPPIILRDWPTWQKSWTREPALLEKEDWSGLTSFASKSSVPAQTWQHVTGEAFNGYGLLESRSKYAFLVDALTDETILTLFAESMELLEVREHKDFRTAAWQYTFTTSMQEQDNLADFRWRCLRSDNPASANFASPDRQKLSDIRATKCTPEEEAFACVGWQKPSVVVDPLDRPVFTEGDAVRIQARAQGVPNPTYQWSLVDPNDKTAKELPGETKAELEVPKLSRGKQMYIVKVSNKVDKASATIVIPVEPPDAVLVKPKSDRPLHLRETSKSSGKKEWQEEKSPVNLSDSSSRKANRLWHGVVLLIVSILVIGTVCFILLEPARRLSFRNWLAVRLPILRTFTNSSPTNEEITNAQKDIPPAQVSATNIDNPQPKPNQNTAEQSESLRSPKLMLDSISTIKLDIPAGWSTVGIGTVAATNVAYRAEKSKSVFSVTAAAEGFYSSGDNVFFVYTTNFGKEFNATLPKISSLIDSRCGIMIRDSTRTNSNFLFIGASDHKISVFLRNQYGFYPWSIEQPGQPVSVKIVLQEGGVCGAEYFDTKRNQWLQPKGNYTVTLKRGALVGFALNSGNLNTTNSADFEIIASGIEH